MDPKRRQNRKVYDSDDDDDFFAAAAPAPPPEEEKPVEIPKPKPGTTIGELVEDAKKKLQKQLLEGMFKFAEQKYGRKKRSAEQDSGASKEDYALYMNSLKVKAKQADSRLKSITKQLKEIQAKVDLAQKDYDLRFGALSDAEKEQENAAKEGRDPILPSSFHVPQRSKKAGATLGSLVMKASKKDWGAALEDFAAKRKSGGGAAQPAWAQKRGGKAAAGKKKEADAPAPQAEAVAS